MPECKTYNAEEAAAVLGINVKTFREAVRYGEAPPRVFRHRWSRAQIDSLAEYGTWDAGTVDHADDVADEAFGG